MKTSNNNTYFLCHIATFVFFAIILAVQLFFIPIETDKERLTLVLANVIGGGFVDFLVCEFRNKKNNNTQEA